MDLLVVLVGVVIFLGLLALAGTRVASARAKLESAKPAKRESRLSSIPAGPRIRR